jgi:hypothetical protein
MRLSALAALLLALFMAFTSHAQDSLSLARQLTTNGKWQLYHRNFFMSTLNRGNLSDYYAWTAGLGLRFESAPYKGFQVAANGFFHGNLSSSDLTEPDSISGSPNRYEIGLVDVENPTQRHLARLEELYLKYNYKKSFVQLGRFILNTPFLNPQDGRMRPSNQGGLWLSWQEWQGWKLQALYLYELSPRSTTRWMSIGESIGRYPTGRQETGQPSQYANNIESPGLILFNAEYQYKEQFNSQLWNTTVLNVANVLFWQNEVYLKKDQDRFTFGLQYIRLDALADGGNADQTKTYLPKGSRSQVFSTRLGWQRGPWSANLNYTHITKEGRFVFPREWGRDPFYTFLPRERNEGLGNVHAIMVQGQFQSAKSPWRAHLGYGHYYLPAATDARLNKYVMSSYGHVLVRSGYQFKGFLRGMSLDFLYVFKHSLVDTQGNPRWTINKVDMHQFNVVLNYVL